MGGVGSQCPAGRYGNSTGMTAATCTGPCSQGYYCKAGSASATAAPCGSVSTFCPQVCLACVRPSRRILLLAASLSPIAAADLTWLGASTTVFILCLPSRQLHPLRVTVAPPYAHTLPLPLHRSHQPVVSLGRARPSSKLYPRGTTRAPVTRLTSAGTSRRCARLGGSAMERDLHPVQVRARLSLRLCPWPMLLAFVFACLAWGQWELACTIRAAALTQPQTGAQVAVARTSTLGSLLLFSVARPTPPSHPVTSSIPIGGWRGDGTTLGQSNHSIVCCSQYGSHWEGL